MDLAAALHLVDTELRQRADLTNAGTVERVDGVLRFASADPQGWAAVLYSELDPGSADRVIAEQVEWFRSMQRACEWKHYSHDLPADLPERLVAAGLTQEDPEALMLAEVVALPQDAELPHGLRIHEVTDAEGVALVSRVHGAVFGGDQARHDRALLQQRQDAPDTVLALVVLDGEEPVSACRLELHEGTAFGSLWGGGTLPAYRHRGIYKATVAHRARVAATRGYRLLRVDASPMSEPILARLGFTRVSTTTPFTLDSSPART